MRGLPRLARFLPKVVLALLVSASAEGYKKLAVWLNDMGMPGGEGPLPATLHRGRCLLPAGMWVAPSLAPLASRELPAGERL